MVGDSIGTFALMASISLSYAAVSLITSEIDVSRLEVSGQHRRASPSYGWRVIRSERCAKRPST
jgi:hypothetical protein